MLSELQKWRLLEDTYDRVPAKAPPIHLVMIIIPKVLLKPKVAVAIDMPIMPYIATGLRPYRSEAYVHGTTI